MAICAIYFLHTHLQFANTQCKYPRTSLVTLVCACKLRLTSEQILYNLYSYPYTVTHVLSVAAVPWYGDHLRGMLRLLMSVKSRCTSRSSRAICMRMNRRLSSTRAWSFTILVAQLWPETRRWQQQIMIRYQNCCVLAQVCWPVELTVLLPPSTQTQ